MKILNVHYKQCSKRSHGFKLINIGPSFIVSKCQRE